MKTSRHHVQWLDSESGMNLGERGISLIETLVASFVLLFGLLSTASLLSYAVATNYENKMDSIATTLAMQRMEQLRNQPISSLVDGGCSLDANGNIDYSASPVTGYSQNSSGSGNVSFDIRWNISTNNGLKRIVVAAGRANGAQRFLSNVLRPVNVSCLKQD